jgi:MFS family permease
MREEDRVFAKCAWRLMPLIMLLYVGNYIDRVNVGFAALTLNKDLGFSPEAYGFGAGAFFISYLLFQVPANVILGRMGARLWISFILAAWGAVSAASPEAAIQRLSKVNAHGCRKSDFKAGRSRPKAIRAARADSIRRR